METTVTISYWLLAFVSVGIGLAFVVARELGRSAGERYERDRTRFWFLRKLDEQIDRDLASASKSPDIYVSSFATRPVPRDSVPGWLYDDLQTYLEERRVQLFANEAMTIASDVVRRTVQES